MAGNSGIARVHVTVDQRRRPKKRVIPYQDEFRMVKRFCQRTTPRISPAKIIGFGIILYFIQYLINPVKAESGYDCTSTDNPVATFSLMDVGECPPMEKAYKPPEATTVQILQRSSEAIIQGFQCQLTIAREACRVRKNRFLQFFLFLTKK